MLEGRGDMMCGWGTETADLKIADDLSGRNLPKEIG